MKPAYDVFMFSILYLFLPPLSASLSCLSLFLPFSPFLSFLCVSLSPCGFFQTCRGPVSCRTRERWSETERPRRDHTHARRASLSAGKEITREGTFQGETAPVASQRQPPGLEAACALSTNCANSHQGKAEQEQRPLEESRPPAACTSRRSCSTEPALLLQAERWEPKDPGDTKRQVRRQNPACLLLGDSVRPALKCVRGCSAELHFPRLTPAPPPPEQTQSSPIYLPANTY